METISTMTTGDNEPVTPQVTIEIVKSVAPLENSDNLDLIKVLGYQSITRRGTFKEGDFCIWHHPDTVVDLSIPCYAFLKDARIRTIKLRGTYSTGLALPISDLLEDKLSCPVEGTDVTSIMGATRYSKGLPKQIHAQAKGSFPAFLIKTDELNLKSHPRLFKEMEEKTTECGVYITGKMDGTSITYYVKDGVFGICSRNLELKPGFESVAGAYAIKHEIEEKLKMTGINIAIQGELIGPGIQGNRHKLIDVEFRMFNQFDIDKQKYLTIWEMLYGPYRVDVKSVDCIYTGHLPSLEDLGQMANSLVDYEGIVVRPNESLYSEYAHRMLSGKIISEKWAAEYGE